MSARAKVQLYGQNRFAYINTDATNGAVIGTNVWNPDGSLFQPAVAATPAQQGVSVTLWELVLEIPANVQEVESLAGSGFVRRDGSGNWTASALTYADIPTAGASDGDALVFTSGVWAPGAVASGGGEILVQDGSSAPPVMLTNEAEDDFLYSD